MTSKIRSTSVLLILTAIALTSLPGCSDKKAEQKAAAQAEDKQFFDAQKAKKLARDEKNKQVCKETIGQAKCEEVGWVYP